ncbi:MAG: hypothetical protein JST11_12225 [Acidobacteria bacterium]|nr:hypothetical protein [Acidobacteriota bacterium]
MWTTAWSTGTAADNSSMKPMLKPASGTSPVPLRRDYDVSLGDGRVGPERHGVLRDDPDACRGLCGRDKSYYSTMNTWYRSPLAANAAPTYHWNVHDPALCPADPEEVAEAYVMGRLPQDQVTAFEDHYVACDACATVLQKQAEYVAAIRSAAKEIRARAPRRAASAGASGSR